jgi:hypothetical protein
MFDAVLGAVVVALVVLEIWWRHRILAPARVIAALVLFAIVAKTPDLGPAVRRALEQPQRIETGPEGHKTVAPEYASGVLAMKREAEQAFDGAIFPAAALAVLAMAPAFRLWMRPRSTDDIGKQR